MVEALLLCVLLLGLLRGARAQHAVAVGAAVVSGYLLVADGLAALDAEGLMYVHQFFQITVAGPGALLDRGTGTLPLPDMLIAHPWVTRLLRISLSSAAAWRCLSESSQLNPLLPRAYVLDALAMPFVAAAVLDALVETSLLYTYLAFSNAT